MLAVLGVADAELLFAAVDAIVARDPAAALRAATRLADSGRDPGQVLRDLELHGRELLTVQVLGEVPPEIRITPERDRRLSEQAQALSGTDTVRLLDLVSAALEATSNGAQARIQLELLLAKAAAPELDPSVAALLSRIEHLEAGRPAAARSCSAAAPAAPSAPSAAPTPRPRTDRAPHRPRVRRTDRASAPAPATRAAREAPTPSPAPSPRPPARRPRPAASTQARAAGRPAPAPSPPAPEGPRPSRPQPSRSRLPPPPGPSSSTSSAPTTRWSPPCSPRPGRPRSPTASLVVAFPVGADFLKRKAEQDDHRRAVGEALRTATGHRLALRYEIREQEIAAPRRERAGAQR